MASSMNIKFRNVFNASNTPLSDFNSGNDDNYIVDDDECIAYLIRLIFLQEVREAK